MEFENAPQLATAILISSTALLGIAGLFFVQFKSSGFNAKHQRWVEFALSLSISCGLFIGLGTPFYWLLNEDWLLFVLWAFFAVQIIAFVFSYNRID